MRRLIYRALRGFSRADRFVRERLTGAGWLIAGSAGAAGLAGVNIQQTITYRAFTLLGALLLLAWAASLVRRPRVTIERELPRYLSAGIPTPYRVRLINRARHPLHDAALIERVSDPRPAFDEWRAAREPGEAKRNWFDRNVGYFRWRWLIDRRTPRAQPAAPVPALAPGATASIELVLEARRRGRIALDGLTVERPDPLGLVKGLTRVALPAHLIALPHRYRVPPLALPGARRYQAGGVALASSIGDSEEFVSLREYRPGDPLQHIHWRSTARVGVPIVKEFQDEYFERHALVLDTAASAEDDTVFEEAVSIAASFVSVIDTQECLLDLLFVAGEVHRYTAGRGQLHAERMLEILAGIAPGARTSFEALAQAVLAHRAQVSSCVLVLVAWDSAREDLMRTLQRAGIELRVILVCERERLPADLPAPVIAVHPGEIEAGLARLAGLPA